VREDGYIQAVVVWPCDINSKEKCLSDGKLKSSELDGCCTVAICRRKNTGIAEWMIHDFCRRAPLKKILYSVTFRLWQGQRTALSKCSAASFPCPCSALSRSHGR